MILALALAGAPAFAQDADADADTAAASADTIVVTGSRIARPEIESPTPVTSLGGNTLEDAGLTKAGDVIAYVPALFSSVSSDLSATRGSVLGGTTLNLRNLGATRTLVLVNGRRHVASDSGTAIVDVDTIPSALIERVDVLTGGASSIYGSDAVTGVVNYVLKRDFTGLELDAQAGISDRGDAGRYLLSGTYGVDLDGGRGNMVISAQYSRSNPISYKDRSFLTNRLDDDANPALRFQAGDITPALAALGARPGQTILLSSGNPRFAGTPQALIDRARTAAPRAFLPNRTFSISSALGLIGLDFNNDGEDDFISADLDGNGLNDCGETYNGRVTGFGCWVVDPITRRVRPFRDGLIAGFANQFGGDGIPVFLPNENVLPSIEQFNFNWTGRYEVSDAFRPFFEAKFVRTKASDVNNVNSFNDTIPIRLDNPFIPDQLRAVIDAFYAANPGQNRANGRLIISRDNTDFGENRRKVERDTLRAVIGADGDIASNLAYEISFNYGRTKEKELQLNRRVEERFYAAVDAVRAPNGQIVCRSTLDPTAIPPTSPFPAFSPPTSGGRFSPVTFQLNDGSCRPLNLFGLGAPSPEAVAFVNPPSLARTELEQYVVQAFLSGTTAGFFNLPGGPVKFVVGGEYRKEKSAFTPDPFDQRKLFYESGTQPESGSFDVKEVFGEVEIPLLADRPFAELLTINGSARYSDYSLAQVGGVFTWGVNGVYAPIADIRVRGGFARSIRAPNITNLFAPVSPATFRPIDPCDATQINRGPRPSVRLANCRADGIPAGFTDPLTARITGAAGGNRNLQEERSDSYTIGGVVQPRFVPGLSIVVDYWNYKITNAIASVSANEIVSGCYDDPNFPNNGFCQLFTRNRTVGSPTFLGFNFLRNSPVNFARFNAEGIDATVSYRTDLGNFAKLDFRFGGTYLIANESFTSVANPDSVNPAVGEAQVPEYAFNAGIGLERDGVRVGWESFYQSKQYFQGVEVEDVGNFATPNRTKAHWSHNLLFRYEGIENLVFRAGIRNITNAKPFASEAAYPVSPQGRNFFLGVTAKY